MSYDISYLSCPSFRHSVRVGSDSAEEKQVDDCPLGIIVLREHSEASTMLALSPRGSVRDVHDPVGVLPSTVLWLFPILFCLLYPYQSCISHPSFSAASNLYAPRPRPSARLSNVDSFSADSSPGLKERTCTSYEGTHKALQHVLGRFFSRYASGEDPR